MLRLALIALLFGTPTIDSLEQYDLDQDGQPDQTVIEVAYAEGGDRVLVYDQGDDMQVSDDWQVATDFANDTWIFTTNDDRARLILAFDQTSEGGYVAELYDDVNGDGRVTYNVQADGTVYITEADFPAVRVTADDYWILPDGAVNPYVHTVMYRTGNPDATFGEINLFPEDGSPAMELRVAEEDGVVYEVFRAFPDIPAEWLYARSGLNIAYDALAPLHFEGSIFWPYLGSVREYPFETGQTLRAPDDHFPPIVVDWPGANVMSVGSILPLWGGNRLRYNSTTPLRWGQTNLLAFERFGHYRFTDHPLPDVIVRWDLHGEVARPDQPEYMYQVSINWHRPDDAGTLRWDYKLELAGVHLAPQDVMQFADFAVRELPYDEWVPWFREQDWAFATFLATEGNSYETNETIYEWNSVEGTIIDITTQRDVPAARDGQQGYLAGDITETPGRFYQQLRTGFRGEYADLYDTPARLYFSPVDRKLHLLHATHGVWPLNSVETIRTGNRAPDAILDEWLHLRHDTVIQRLHLTDDYLIYGDTDEVGLTTAPTSTALFKAVPPANRDEWLALEAKLQAHERPFAPDDFRPMFLQFGKPVWIEKATISEFHDRETGFQFVLHLQPGYRPVGDLPFDLREPGDYVVTYDGEDWSSAPLTAPHLEITGLTFETPTALHPVEVVAQIHNHGTVDVEDLRLRFAAENTIGEAVIAYLPARETARAAVVWSPREAGKQPVSVDVLAGDVLMDSQRSSVQVQAAQELPVQQYVSLLDEHAGQGVFIYVLLLAQGVLAGGLLFLVLRQEVNRA